MCQMKIKMASWQILQQVRKKQHEIEGEMKQMKEAFKEKWNQWGIKRPIQKRGQ